MGMGEYEKLDTQIAEHANAILAEVNKAFTWGKVDEKVIKEHVSEIHKAHMAQQELESENELGR